MGCIDQNPSAFGNQHEYNEWLFEQLVNLDGCVPDAPDAPDAPEMVFYGVTPPDEAPVGALFTDENTIKLFVHQGEGVWVEHTNCVGGDGGTDGGNGPTQPPPGFDGVTFEALTEDVNPSNLVSQGQRVIGRLHGIPDGYSETDYWEYYDVEQSVSVNATEYIQVYRDLGPYPPRWKCVKKATGNPVAANLSITFTQKTDPSKTKTFSSQVMVLLY